MGTLTCSMLSLSLIVTLLSSKVSKSTVTAYGVPISSALLYRRPIAPESSNSTMYFFLKSWAICFATGLNFSSLESGKTATLIGASLGSSLNTVLLSTPPLEFGASSSSYASSRKAKTALVKPAEGSIT